MREGRGRSRRECVTSLTVSRVEHSFLFLPEASHLLTPLLGNPFILASVVTPDDIAPMTTGEEIAL